MKTTNRSRNLAALVGAASLAAAGICQATTINYTQLTGAGPGEGLTLNASQVVDAIFANVTGGTTSYTVQGVSFTPFSQVSSSVFSVSAPGGAPTLTPSTGVNNSPSAAFSGGDTTNANDVPLCDMVNSGVFWGGANNNEPTFTVSQLSPNTTYVITLLYCSTGYSNRSMNDSITSSGVSNAQFSIGPGEQIFDTLDTFTTGPSATSISGTMIANDGTGYFNAIVVSTVPEPASIGLLGLAVVGTTLRRRSRKGGSSSTSDNSPLQPDTQGSSILSGDSGT